MRKVVLVSYTPIGASGGVPRWNRDFRSAFPEAVHYSWQDVLPHVGGQDRWDVPEWTKAEILNKWLIWSKRIDRDDIVFVDGFWGRGLEDLPNVVSVCHGNWSHTTKDDVDAGVEPEFPDHHRAQLTYRKNHVMNGGRLVAVSEFISHQCDIQWGFKMPVINNGIDTRVFVPTDDKKPRNRPVILHGTTTANKGLDHIALLKKGFDADVLLLDEAADFFRMPKYRALAQADLFVHPSAHEGNSYMVLETLACGVPLVSYDVGLMYEARQNADPDFGYPGAIMERRIRSPQETLTAVKVFFSRMAQSHVDYVPRKFAEMYSLDRFRREWKSYMKSQFEYVSPWEGNEEHFHGRT